MSGADLVALIRVLNPDSIPGKLTLFSRLGAKSVKAKLPELIRAVRDAQGLITPTTSGKATVATSDSGVGGGGGAPAIGRDAVVWSCDPMHGNTLTDAKQFGPFKTRRLTDIMQELSDTIAIHSALGSRLAGVHLELTAEHVTECTSISDGCECCPAAAGDADGTGSSGSGSGGGGDDEAVTAKDLPKIYTTACDPRLNRSQSIQVRLIGVRVRVRVRVCLCLGRATDRIVSCDVWLSHTDCIQNR